MKNISVLLLALLLLAGSISAQTVKITVKDSKGEALIGAYVIEQGTHNGGVTDLDGNFTINLKAGKPIVDQETANGFYYNDLFKGWDCKSAPIYLVPISQNGLIGGLTNGYGFTSTF